MISEILNYTEEGLDAKGGDEGTIEVTGELEFEQSHQAGSTTDDGDKLVEIPFNQKLRAWGKKIIPFPG